jgi:hypothetical protein
MFPFREIWCVDFEYRSDPGCHPWVVAMVAHEVKTGRHIRMWRNELLELDRAPFDIGRDCLFVYAGKDVNPRSLMNYKMQANGAEMMRIAAIAATEAGIEVCAPVHDAFLIMAPLEMIQDQVETMRQIMEKASRAVTGVLTVRVDHKIVRWPARYMDKRGKVMWDRVTGILASFPSTMERVHVSGTPTVPETIHHRLDNDTGAEGVSLMTR